ncbi:repressor of RNA polymerase III transcription MAF1 homolog isoform X2 [Symsagittifera roscoffensis]|uniref:repressor of RNA polymerase III transcription MAF1 homolog isoform X2 n=1 Tax=Symsagittifera roscoffensis TaxID=84072 RepID=UPI00307BAE69
MPAGSLVQMLPLSPPDDKLFSTSPNKNFSRCQSSSDEDQLQQINPFSALCKKTHFFLVSTLNKSFHPDYSFSSTPSTDFSREPNLSQVVNTVDSLLLTLGGSYYSSMFKPKLWEAIDREISLRDCEVYKYCPDLNCGPFGEPGVLWSFNYLFYNKKMKRIVYICCIARSGYAEDNDSLRGGMELYMTGEDEEEDLSDVDLVDSLEPEVILVE